MIIKFDVLICSILVVFCFPQSLIAESRAEIYPEKNISFINEGKIITLSLSYYSGGEGVIVSPDKSLKGFPYIIGALRYGYRQPYIFSPNRDSSQAVLIPYMAGGGTGFAVGDWCLAVNQTENVYIECLGLWHYHCCGPRDDFVSFDISPSFFCYYDGTLGLVFFYEEIKNGETELIKGEIVLKMSIGKDGLRVTLEPHRVENALKVADLLTKYGISEWAWKCLNTILPDEMKPLKEYKDKVPPGKIEDLKKKIKQYYDNKEQ